jgi:hypothetical protein
LDFAFWPSIERYRAHNSLYEPRPFHARKGMLQRFIFAVFSGGSYQNSGVFETIEWKS